MPRCWVDDELFNLNIIVCSCVWTSVESWWLTLKSYPSLTIIVTSIKYDIIIIYVHNYTSFSKKWYLARHCNTGNWFNSKPSHTCTQYHSMHVVFGLTMLLCDVSYGHEPQAMFRSLFAKPWNNFCDIHHYYQQTFI